MHVSKRSWSRGVVVLAQVLGATPGFNIDDLSPTSLVQVRVDHVYRNQSGVSLREGLRLTYQTRGGSLRIGTTELCVNAEGDLNVRDGDKVVILGTIDRRLPSHIYPDDPFGVVAVSPAGNLILSSTAGGPVITMPLSALPQHLDDLAPDQRHHEGHPEAKP
jgi:hypothetical protein